MNSEVPYLLNLMPGIFNLFGIRDLYFGISQAKSVFLSTNSIPMKRILFISATILLTFSLFAQPAESLEEKAARMQWFKDAKLGIFIHWGIYAVKGIDESWSFYNGKISHENYLKQLKGFTAKKYDAQKWAALFEEAGAKYAVLTSKHHDGVALWDTRCGNLSVVRQTPAKKDLVQPFVNALRQYGLKAGLYYSLLDWSHPDYPNKALEIKGSKHNFCPPRGLAKNLSDYP